MFPPPINKGQTRFNSHDLSPLPRYRLKQFRKMPETKNYVFDHLELAEILVKQQNIHEGLWGVYIEFGFAAANINTDPSGKVLAPGTLNFVQKVGIQRFPEPNNLTVDAAKVNPQQPVSTKRRSKKRR